MYSVLPGGDGGCDGRLPDLPWEGGRKNMVGTIVMMMMMMVMVLVRVMMIDQVGGWVAGVAVVCGGDLSIFVFFMM